MDRLIFDSLSEADTARLGAALAEALPDGTVVALIGTLGAGKTRLVQAAAEALGVDRRDATSPTFVLIQEYRGRRVVYHVDAYRLRNEEEFQSLGPDECFESGGLAFVEWADRVARCLPADRLEIRIEVAGPDVRRFELTALGPRSRAAMPRLSAMIDKNRAGR